MHRYLMSYRRFAICAALALAVPVVTPATAWAGRPVQSAAALPTIAGVPHARLIDLGRAARSLRVDVAIALNYRRPAELDAFISATSDPASPEYGHFLSPAQFVAAFAPSVADYDRVAAALVQAGFTITRTTPNRTIVNAWAPAAVAEAFFGTVFHAVKQDASGDLRYANATPAAVPAALRSAIYGVAGLNDLIVAKADNERAGTRRVDTALGLPVQGPDTGLSPFALASAYDLPVQHARPNAPAGQTYDGTGHAAGIAIDSDFFDTDLASFLSYFHITRSAKLVRVAIDGGSGGVTFDSVETTLDVETIAGLAPGAPIYLYLMPELTTAAILDAYSQVVADDKVDVLNSSFGGCEISTDNFATLSDHVAQQGAAEGITFSAATGDYGAQACIGVTPTYLGVSAPASGPHFTAVGGTSLIVTPAAAYKMELAWQGSGGGVSTIFARPAYQKGVPNIIGATRNLPDVALDANPGTGASFFFDGAFQGPIGGTSLASPIFSAFVSEHNETLGKRSGNIDTALYAGFKQTGYGVVFRDILFGNNSYFGTGYNASAGYDDVTGIGSIIGTPHAK